MILITGHKGFVGGHLTERLKNYGFVKDNLDGTIDLSVNSIKENSGWIGFDLVDGDDIRNKYELAKVFAIHRIDRVIHLAAEAGLRRGERYPDEYITRNIIGTRNLLELAEENNVKHFIFFSSSSVFGGQTPPFGESSPLKPDCVYGMTKAAGEVLCYISPIPTTIVRPFSVYGENGRGDQVIYKWLNQIKAGEPISFYGTGNSKRGYVYVGDLVDGVIKLIDRKPKDNYETFNLGGQEIITLNALLKVFKSVFKGLKIKKYPLPKADALENWSDIDKAQTALSWYPNTDFKKKVKEIIEKEL